jgi:hypothetical protein
LAIVLCVLRFTLSDYPIGFFKLFLEKKKYTGIKKTFPDFYPVNKPTLASAKKKNNYLKKST